MDAGRIQAAAPAWIRPAWPAALAGLLLGLLALGPGLGRGFLLSYDMVAVPGQPFTAATFGWGGELPRAVPSDAVTAAAARVLPADIVQKLFLLAIFVLAAAGLATLLADQHWLARLAGAVCYAWNPYVAERLIIGQWALLLGYAGLPWVLAAVTRPAATWWRWAGRLALALLPAAVGGFSAMCISALVALPAAACARCWPGGAAPRSASPEDYPRSSRPPIAASRRTPDRGEHACGAPRLAAALAVGLTLLVLLMLSLPWLVPALSRPVYTSPAGVAAFAARADTPFGALGSLVMLGGAWNAQTVPAGYGGPLATPWLLFALAALAAYLVLGRARWPGLTIAAAAGLAIACIGLTSPGRALLQTLIGAWPGFAVLRDGQQFVAPLALAEAAGAGLGTAWLLRLRRPAALADLRYLLAAIAVLAPVVLLPGLAWGAAGRLRPVQYPAGWLAARQLIDADRAPGSALLLPWAAYRRFGWNHGAAVLDPWPRLLRRPVIFNDGVQVGSTRIPPEDAQARLLNALITSGAPLSARLRRAGVRFVIVDAGFGGRAGRYPFRGRLPGARVLLAGPGLVVYQLPSG
jgi:hypothetical protein